MGRAPGNESFQTISKQFCEWWLLIDQNKSFLLCFTLTNCPCISQDASALCPLTKQRTLIFFFIPLMKTACTFVFISVGTCSFDPVKKELVWDVSSFNARFTAFLVKWSECYTQSLLYTPSPPSCWTIGFYFGSTCFCCASRQPNDHSDFMLFSWPLFVNNKLHNFFFSTW